MCSLCKQHHSNDRLLHRESGKLDGTAALGGADAHEQRGAVQDVGDVSFESEEEAAKLQQQGADFQASFKHEHSKDLSEGNTWADSSHPQAHRTHQSSAAASQMSFSWKQPEPGTGKRRSSSRSPSRMNGARPSFLPPGNVEQPAAATPGSSHPASFPQAPAASSSFFRDSSEMVYAASLGPAAAVQQQAASSHLPERRAYMDDEAEDPLAREQSQAAFNPQGFGDEDEQYEKSPEWRAEPPVESSSEFDYVNSYPSQGAQQDVSSSYLGSRQPEDSYQQQRSRPSAQDAASLDFRMPLDAPIPPPPALSGLAALPASQASGSAAQPWQHIGSSSQAASKDAERGGMPQGYRDEPAAYSGRGFGGSLPSRCVSMRAPMHCQFLLCDVMPVMP